MRSLHLVQEGCTLLRPQSTCHCLEEIGAQYHYIEGKQMLRCLGIIRHETHTIVPSKTSFTLESCGWWSSRCLSDPLRNEVSQQFFLSSDHLEGLSNLGGNQLHWWLWMVGSRFLSRQAEAIPSSEIWGQSSWLQQRRRQLEKQGKMNFDRQGKVMVLKSKHGPPAHVWLDGPWCQLKCDACGWALTSLRTSKCWRVESLVMSCVCVSGFAVGAEWGVSFGCL